MRTYEPSLWDGSDPTYAPHLNRTGQHFYWRPSRAALALGYAMKPVKLPSGDDSALERASLCRDYTRGMVRWMDSLSEKPKVEPMTWLWLIGRYKADEFSPFQDVKANTRQQYLDDLKPWETAIGSTMIADTDHTAIKRWQKAMKDKGRSTAYIKKKFTMLRLVASYGVMLKAPGAKDVREILSGLRLPSSPRRSVSPTEGQIMAVVKAADAAGDHGFALGILLQWWLTLRAVDVRGHFLKCDDGKRRWTDGLTWNMIDKDITRLSKVVSKTERSNPEPMVFDLTPLADVRARLLAVPLDKRIGPVILRKNGTPFDRKEWAWNWRTYATAAGVPDEVQMRDTRAGAITDAELKGASIRQMQRQAGHASPDMTERYARGEEGLRREVIELRVGTTRQQG